MLVRKLTLKGFRGFSEEQSLRFAQPTGKPGSGITVLVGPNNGGKSTVIEAMQAWSVQDNISFSEGKRNKLAGDSVLIQVESSDGMHELRTVDTGGSEVLREPSDPPMHCYVLPSRRFFNPYFSSGQLSRRAYLSQNQLPDARSTSSDSFSYRLFNALRNLADFNRVFAKIVNPPPVWTIELSDQGSYYLKMNSDGQYHNSDGLGEGIVSLLFIVDALYDSQEGDLIVIDEPELSLHPAYQRRLATVLADYAKDRQIVYATHSPYFVDFVHVLNGAEVARVHKRSGSCYISQLDRETAERFKGMLKDSHNPHVLGLEAREALFREDGVVVVEGQDDVVLYPNVLSDLAAAGRLTCEDAAYLEERFFGWGAGGAEKIQRIVELLHDLGFERVAGISDKNKAHLVEDLKRIYPGYEFVSIPADDVRTKTDPPVVGLLDESHRLRQEYACKLAGLFTRVAVRLRANTCDA